MRAGAACVIRWRIVRGVVLGFSFLVAGGRSTRLRRLDDEEVTFQSLLDDTRKDLAIRYLVKSDPNNQQIAHLVGYRDPKAFQRAFRNWTGKTPQTLRAERLN